MKRIITISREFGSGGRSLGKQLAEKLGWKYYDKELVKQVAEKTGFDPAYIEEVGEHSATKSPLSYLFSTPGTPGVMKGMSAADFLWIMQRNVIVNLVKEGPCVIVGRCADYILRDEPNVLRVFVYASKERCIKTVADLYNLSPKEAERQIDRIDRARSTYYRYYTGEEWDNARNYDLCLNSEMLGFDRCVDLIEHYLKVLYPEK